jgi:hypothetical protein
VTEELRLEERVGQRRAVQAEERPTRAPREPVQRLGDDLLADTRLAQDQDGQVTRGHALDELEDPQHGRVLDDDAGRDDALGGGSAERQLARRRALGVADDDPDAAELDDLARLDLDGLVPGTTRPGARPVGAPRSRMRSSG